MKIYKRGNYEYWYDRSTRCWYCAKFDKEGNKIGDASGAYTKPEIITIIDSKEERK